MDMTILGCMEDLGLQACHNLAREEIEIRVFNVPSDFSENILKIKGNSEE